MERPTRTTGLERQEDESPPVRRHREALEKLLRSGQTAGTCASIWRRDGWLLASTESHPLPQRLQMEDWRTNPAPRMVRNPTAWELTGGTARGEVIRVISDVGKELRQLSLLGWQLGSAGAGILGLGLAGGWWAATRSLRPLGQISATASGLSAGNLRDRVKLESPATELEELTIALNAMLSRLDASFTQQRRFISDAAHELRTPVSVIVTQVQTALRRDRPAEEYRQSLEVCQRASQRMRQLIGSLLTLARLDTGEQAMKRLRFDLARAVSEQVDLLAPLAAAQQVRLEFSGDPLLLEGDPDYLSIAAANLIGNALHHTGEGGRVSVEVSRIPGEARLRVEDTGEGIPPEALKKIFDRFYRGDHSRSLPAGRTGLGLAITQSIAAAHGGSIDVQSTVGTGTVFTIRLPLGAALPFPEPDGITEER